MGITRVMKDPTCCCQCLLTQYGGLEVGIQGGKIDVANQSIDVAFLKTNLVASSVNYIFIDWATKALSVNQTGFPVKAKTLYEVTTSVDGITGIVDRRASFRYDQHTEFLVSATDWLLNINTGVDVDWTILDLSAIAPVGATGVFLGVVVMDSGAPNSNCEMKLKQRSSDNLTYQSIVVYPQASGLWVSFSGPLGMTENGKIRYYIKVSGTFYARLQLLGWIFGGSQL